LFKKIIDWVCLFSISTSIGCFIYLMVIGARNNGVIILGRLFGFAPWPMEWIMANGPLIIFAPTWLAFRYGVLIQKNYAFISRGILFGLLSVMLMIVTLLGISIRR
jgi:hypothetical protein